MLKNLETELDCTLVNRVASGPDHGQMLAESLGNVALGFGSFAGDLFHIQPLRLVEYAGHHLCGTTEVSVAGKRNFSSFLLKGCNMLLLFYIIYG